MTTLTAFAHLLGTPKGCFRKAKTSEEFITLGSRMAVKKFWKNQETKWKYHLEISLLRKIWTEKPNPLCTLDQFSHYFFFSSFLMQWLRAFEMTTLTAFATFLETSEDCFRKANNSEGLLTLASRMAVTKQHRCSRVSKTMSLKSTDSLGREVLCGRRQTPYENLAFHWFWALMVV